MGAAAGNLLFEGGDQPKELLRVWQHPLAALPALCVLEARGLAAPLLSSGGLVLDAGFEAGGHDDVRACGKNVLVLLTTNHIKSYYGLFQTLIFKMQ
jgi:hypothetical protein